MDDLSRWTKGVAMVLLLVASATATADSTARPVRMPVRIGLPAGQSRGDSGARPVRMVLPPVQTDGDSARVVGKLVNGLIVVPVSINGAGPFWLGMDTGAMGHLRLNDSVAQGLALPMIGRVLAADPSGRNPRELKRYHVDSLAIGNVRFRGADATGTPDTLMRRRLQGVDGILGIDLFTDLLLTLDYPKAELRLTRAKLPPPNGSDILAYELERGSIRLPLQVGEKQIVSDLDTGNLIAPFVFPTDFALIAAAEGRAARRRDGAHHQPADGDPPRHTRDSAAARLVRVPERRGRVPGVARAREHRIEGARRLHDRDRSTEQAHPPSAAFLTPRGRWGTEKRFR